MSGAPCLLPLEARWCQARVLSPADNVMPEDRSARLSERERDPETQNAGAAAPSVGPGSRKWADAAYHRDMTTDKGHTCLLMRVCVPLCVCVCAESRAD